MNCRNTGQQGFYSWHVGTCHALLFDGAVRALSENMGAAPFTALITREAGEVIGDF
jgi:hypothetical protein